ncbi:oligosaccharide flippase family protein [bacterium]|nr:oligosaccharide flippase family protein [bacterium]
MNQTTPHTRTHLALIGTRFFWVAAGNVASKAMMFVANIWLANRLLEQGFGALNVAFTIVNYLALFAFSGIDTVATRHAAGLDEPLLRRCAGELVALRTVTSLALFVLSLAAGFLLPGMAGTMTVMYAFSFLPQCINVVNLFYGVEWTWPVTIYYIGGRVVYLGLLLAFVRGTADGAAAALAFGAAILAENVFLYVLWARRHGARMFASPRAATWLPAVPIMLASAAVLLHENAGIIAVYAFRGESAAGLYCASYRLVYVAISLTALFSFVYLARYTRIERGDAAARRLFFLRVAGVCMAAGLAASAVLSVIARPLVALVYRPVYADSGVLLSVAVWQFALAPVRVIAFQTLNACHAQRRAAAMALLGAVVSLAAVITGVMAYGIMGAVAGTIIGEAALGCALCAAAVGAVNRAGAGTRSGNREEA